MPVNDRDKSNDKSNDKSKSKDKRLLHSFKAQCALGFLIRLVMIGYGVHHDAKHTLKYTDIDYSVFSEATTFLLNPSDTQHAQGWLTTAIGDPYAKATYRYTPLLALLLVPNNLVHPLFGKVLFSAADIYICILMAKLLRLRHVSTSTTSRIVNVVWLFNPMTINISTRGSSESILGALVLSCLYAAETDRWDLAAAWLGLATHFKIYPFIYAVSFVARLSDTRSISSFARSLFSRDVLRFGLISFTTFMVLNGLMYLIWGKPFLDEAFLYHFHRLDAAHNFSPAFYPLQRDPHSLSPAVTFVPQLLATFAAGLVFGKLDLGYAWFLQTAIFVTFNRVCTSQYFLWYLWLLPCAIIRTRLSWKTALVLISAWVAGQAVWLHIAYKLEFLHEPVHRTLWMASLGFQVINSVIVGTLVLSTDYTMGLKSAKVA